MAGKKVYGITDAIHEFKSVMQRSALERYCYVNGVLLSKSKKGGSVLVIPDPELWNALLDDEEFKQQIQEFDLLNPETANDRQLFEFGEKIHDDGWVTPDIESFCKGTPVKVQPPGFEYSFTFTRDIFPLKFRKAEQNNISYHLFLKPTLTLVVQKRFVFKELEQYGWHILRIFQVL